LDLGALFAVSGGELAGAVWALPADALGAGGAGADAAANAGSCRLGTVLTDMKARARLNTGARTSTALPVHVCVTGVQRTPPSWLRNRPPPASRATMRLTAAAEETVFRPLGSFTWPARRIIVSPCTCCEEAAVSAWVSEAIWEVSALTAGEAGIGGGSAGAADMMAGSGCDGGAYRARSAERGSR